MKFEEFKERMEGVYHQRFNKSHCVCSLSENLFDCPSITVSFLFEDEKDVMSASVEAYVSYGHPYYIDLPSGWTTADDLPEEMKMNGYSQYVNLKLRPWQLSIPVAVNRREVPWTNVRGNADAIIAAFAEYVDNLYEAIKAEYEADNLRPAARALVQEKGYFD